jgi:hypothetical protein
MKTNTESTQKGNLAGRVAQLEKDVQALCDYISVIIATVKFLPEPPCPPMCGFELLMEEKSLMKKKSDKKRGSRKR